MNVTHGDGVRLFLRDFMKKYIVFLVICLLGSGWGYRLEVSRYSKDSLSGSKIIIGLKEFPLEHKDWQGKDVPMSEAIQKVAGNDDYLNRYYYNEELNIWSFMYVAFTAQPRNMLGHRPQVCYKGAGWISDGPSKIDLITDAGFLLPCLLHHFKKPFPSNEELYVLNFYVMNGKVTNDEDSFAGIGFRAPNIDGKIANYVMQVQFAATLEQNVTVAVKELSDEVLDFLPEISRK